MKSGNKCLTNSCSTENTLAFLLLASQRGYKGKSLFILYLCFSFLIRWCCFHLLCELTRHLDGDERQLIPWVTPICYLLILDQIWLYLHISNISPLTSSENRNKHVKQIYSRENYMSRTEVSILCLHGSHNVEIVAFWYFSLNGINLGQQLLLC